jgi:hypothetical protein
MCAMTGNTQTIGWLGLAGVAVAAVAGVLFGEPPKSAAPDVAPPVISDDAAVHASGESTVVGEAAEVSPMPGPGEAGVGETRRILERDRPPPLSVNARPAGGGREVSLVVKLKDPKLAQSLAALYARSPAEAEARVRALLAESKVDPRLIEGLAINNFSLGGEADIRVKISGGGDLTQRTEELAAALERAPGVAYAEPNYEAVPFGDVKP